MATWMSPNSFHPKWWWGLHKERALNCNSQAVNFCVSVKWIHGWDQWLKTDSGCSCPKRVTKDNSQTIYRSCRFRIQKHCRTLCFAKHPIHWELGTCTSPWTGGDAQWCATTQKRQDQQRYRFIAVAFGPVVSPSTCLLCRLALLYSHWLLIDLLSQQCQRF